MVTKIGGPPAYGCYDWPPDEGPVRPDRVRTNTGRSASLSAPRSSWLWEDSRQRHSLQGTCFRSQRTNDGRSTLSATDRRVKCRCPKTRALVSGFRETRGMAPAIQAHRDECERQRRLIPALFRELQRAGIFNLTVPRAFGGSQVDIRTFVSVIEELARHDGSVGWNAMIAGSYGFLADYLPEATAEAIFGGGDALVAGTLTPNWPGRMDAGRLRRLGPMVIRQRLPQRQLDVDSPPLAQRPSAWPSSLLTSRST